MISSHENKEPSTNAEKIYVGIDKNKLQQCMGKPRRKFKSNDKVYYVYQPHHARCRIIFKLDNEQVVDVYATDLLNTKIPLEHCPDTKMDCLS